jgi:uncharacterized membrane protein
MALHDNSFQSGPGRSTRSVITGAAVLGFAFGAFFDGILLHQVLQWHHFLSLVPGKDLQTQIMADGLFHLAVYVVALFGLVLLWRTGRYDAGDRAVLAWAVLGFSIWQFSDVVLVHWMTGIHRIRVDVPNPILWDLGWLATFGVPSLIVGIWLLRSPDNPGDQLRTGSSRGVAAALSIAVISTGLFSVYPSSGANTAVLFRPGVGSTAAFAAVTSVDARLIWSAPDGEIILIHMPTSSSRIPLYQSGAILVTSTSWIGCIGSSRAGT